jgi:hypothetical protein
MKNSYLIIWLFVATYTIKAQQLELYSRTTENVYSTAIADTFVLDVAYPKNLDYASKEVAYPLIILFDSYNTYTFSHHLKTIDMLTYHGQMPEAIIVGIPFTWQNRYSLTSIPKIDSLESFVFNQIIPAFKAGFNATGPLLIFGHSRTGYAVGYFTMKNSDKFQAAGVFSGFLDVGFDLKTTEQFLAERTASTAPFAFYYSAGKNTKEEETYLQDLEQLQSVFTQVPDKLKTMFFAFGYANHMTNYNLSVEAALLDYFGPYNLILDEWIFNKLDNLDTVNASTLLNILWADFNRVSEQLGGTVQPGISHILSIANHYMNNDANKALPLLTFGKRLYPGDYDLDYYLADTYIRLHKTENARQTIVEAKERLAADKLLSEEEKLEWLEAYNTLLAPND